MIIWVEDGWTYQLIMVDYSSWISQPNIWWKKTIISCVMSPGRLQFCWSPGLQPQVLASQALAIANHAWSYQDIIAGNQKSISVSSESSLLAPQLRPSITIFSNHQLLSETYHTSSDDSSSVKYESEHLFLNNPRYSINQCTVSCFSMINCR